MSEIAVLFCTPPWSYETEVAFQKLYTSIFDRIPDEATNLRIKSKSNTLLLLAQNDQGEAIAFKLGYEDDPATYYSWLGGVLPAYRNKGVGSLLMDAQHTWCKERGYRAVRTKTRNQWRAMLVRNIKSGFDIVETYAGEDGDLRIVMEKRL